MNKYELETEIPPVGRLVQEVTFSLESPEHIIRVGIHVLHFLSYKMHFYLKKK